MVAVALRELGMARGSVDELVARGVTRALLPHGLGHSLGVTVHDGGISRARRGRKTSSSGNPGSSGQVFTIEPGIYIIEACWAAPGRRPPRPARLGRDRRPAPVRGHPDRGQHPVEKVGIATSRARRSPPDLVRPDYSAPAMRAFVESSPCSRRGRVPEGQRRPQEGPPKGTTPGRARACSASRRPRSAAIPPPLDFKTPPADATKTASGLVYKKLNEERRRHRAQANERC